MFAAVRPVVMRFHLIEVVTVVGRAAEQQPVLNVIGMLCGQIVAQLHQYRHPLASCIMGQFQRCVLDEHMQEEVEPNLALAAAVVPDTLATIICVGPRVVMQGAMLVVASATAAVAVPLPLVMVVMLPPETAPVGVQTVTGGVVVVVAARAAKLVVPADRVLYL